VRRLTAVVAVVAMGGLWWGLSLAATARRHTARTDAHTGMASEALFEAEQYRAALRFVPSGHPHATRFRRFETRERARALHYRALASKYARAARSPWLPVAPDPPDPK
jgi:hypothetical protein